MIPDDPLTKSRGKHPSIDLEIRRAIVSGRWKPGQRVPTWDELEERFGVARGTIMRAMDLLKRDGFVESRGRRLGMIVAESPPHLCRYGILFSDAPSNGRSGSRFCEALWHEAERLAGRKGNRVVAFQSAPEPGNGLVCPRLVGEARNHCLAGVILASASGEPVNRMVRGVRRLPKVRVGWDAHGSMSTPEVTAGSVLEASTGDSGESARLGSDIPVLQLQHELLISRALEHLAARRRRRVALLVANECPDAPPFSTWVADLARAGMETRPAWQLCVPASIPVWASHAMQLLFDTGGQDRPDALIITDDRLTEEATAGIAATGVQVPSDLDVVTLCNFPRPPVTHVPARMLGYDCTAIAQTCLDFLERERAGDPSPAVTLFPPIFEEELPRHA